MNDRISREWFARVRSFEVGAKLYKEALIDQRIVGICRECGQDAFVFPD